MTPHETAAVLALMKTAWPSAELGPGTPTIWADELRNVHPDDGLTTAHTLIRTSKWFPTISEFLEAARSVTRWRLEESKPLELEQDTLTREERKANVARLVAETKRVVDANRARSRRLRPQNVNGRVR